MRILAAAVVATLALAGPVVAGDAATPAGVFIGAQTQDQYLARDHLIGAKVHNAEGAIIGDIEDLIISDSNQVVGVVMGTGGFFGMAEKKIGVHLSALQFDDSTGTQVVKLKQATKDNLTAAPAFERTQPRKSLLERAKEKAQEFSDKTTESTKDAYEKAQPALEQAKEKAKEAYEKAKEAVAPAVEKAKEAVQGAVDTAKDAAKPEAAPTPAVPAPAAPAPAIPAPAP